jgi:hypothetical protein
VTGFERSKGLAELAGKNAGCEIIQGNFEVHDFSELNFDAILLCGSLVHVPHERFAIVFENIIKGLVQDGKILISIKQGQGSWSDAEGRKFYFWKDSVLRDVFAKNGFNILEFHKDISKVNAIDTWLNYVLKK